MPRSDDEDDDDETYDLVCDFIRENLLDSETGDGGSNAYETAAELVDAIESECEVSVLEDKAQELFKYCTSARSDMACIASHIHYVYSQHEAHTPWPTLETVDELGTGLTLPKSRQLSERFHENVGVFCDEQIELVRNGLVKKIADKILGVTVEIDDDDEEEEEDDEPPDESDSDDDEEDDEEDEDYNGNEAFEDGEEEGEDDDDDDDVDENASEVGDSASESGEEGDEKNSEETQKAKDDAEAKAWLTEEDWLDLHPNAPSKWLSAEQQQDLNERIKQRVKQRKEEYEEQRTKSGKRKHAAE